ncbi:MAG TPA: hypothetical protein VMS76_05475 [Planctomycetota bacterium]|nr:hypothetical protein [Planctomycetota bacterium]
MSGRAPTRDAAIGVGQQLPLLLIALFATLIAARRLEQTFWLDELWVVRLLRDGAASDTPVPLLFRWLASASGGWLGYDELALRLPALAGLLALLLLPAALPRRQGALLGPREAIHWALLCALSSPMLFYAAQAKQYTWDAAVGAALLVAYVRFERDPAAARPLALLVAGAWLAVLAITPGALLALPVLAAAAFRIPWRELDALTRRRHALLLGAGGLLAAATLGALFAVSESIRAGWESVSLAEWWQPRFWDGSLAFVLAGSKHWLGHFLNLLRGGLLLLAAACLVWLARGDGTVRRRALLLALACALVALTLGASAFGLYPYGETRLMLFAAPGVLALFAAGIATIERAAGRWSLVPVALFYALFAWQGVVRDTYDATYMRHRDTREANEAVRALWRPGTAVVAPSAFLLQLEHYHPELDGDLASEIAPGTAQRVIHVRPEGSAGESLGRAPERSRLRIPLRGFELELVESAAP